MCNKVYKTLNWVGQFDNCNIEFPGPISLQHATMASRRLALNLKQAFRSRAALRHLQPERRGFATPVNHELTTESTTLSNGLTVSPQVLSGKSGLLTSTPDCDRTLTLGTDIDCWGVD